MHYSRSSRFCGNCLGAWSCYPTQLTWLTLKCNRTYTILSKVLGHPILMNYSVSVEELDWSAESQVLIPAEHLWCDFKCRPCAKHSSPNTNDLYIHYMDKSTGTPPSLEEKNALPNCGNKEINVLKNCISTSVATVLKCMKWLYHMSLVFGDEF